MSSRKTTHYQLNQYEAQDLILRADANADNTKIDDALHAHDDAITALRQWLNTPGEILRIASGSYVGNGNGGTHDDPNSLTFDFRPMIVVVYEMVTAARVYGLPYAIMLQGLPLTNDASGMNGNGTLDVTWNGNSVSWTYPGVFASGDMNAADLQYNTNGTTYRWLALGYTAADA